MAKYRIKLSENMAKQVEGVKRTFDTMEQAHRFATTKYGSGSEDSKYGWSIEEVKNPDFVNPTVEKTIETAAGTAHYVKTEIEDTLGRWNDNYYTKDGYWVIHEGRQHHVYKVGRKGKGWHESPGADGKAPVHKKVAERAQAKHAQNTPMGKKDVLLYRVEEDGKYHLDADGSGRFGLPFSSYEKMRKAIKRKFKLKKVRNRSR